MPRSARAASESGIYHVTTRGSGKRVLFEDDDDRRFYLGKLEFLAADTNCSILAWCLMDNHVHLLVEGALDGMSKLMHRLSTSYARRFNGRHGHVGSVFQGRFASFPITTDAHLMAAVRYIHLNSRDLGMRTPDEYEWSSYHQYLGETGICATGRVSRLFDSIEAFKAFHDIGEDEVRIIELNHERWRISDAEARRISATLFGEHFLDEVGEMAKPERDCSLKRLYQAGLSFRQISRLTGVGASTVQRAKESRTR